MKARMFKVLEEAINEVYADYSGSIPTIELYDDDSICINGNHEEEMIKLQDENAMLKEEILQLKQTSPDTSVNEDEVELLQNLKNMGIHSIIKEYRIDELLQGLED